MKTSANSYSYTKRTQTDAEGKSSIGFVLDFHIHSRSGLKGSVWRLVLNMPKNDVKKETLVLLTYLCFSFVCHFFVS